MVTPTEFSSSSTVQYLISADVHPCTASRVLDLFALRGITPEHIKVSQYKKTPLIRESLCIDIRVSGLTSHEQDVILQKISAQICVQNVRIETIFKRIAA
ncbi:MAG: hypothetical protein HOH19_11655 [Kordiimonadaceae bacterium]|nr:hypothetical protein [Kordiimonadaceae bacterium]MBT6033225.1 hypothetical protein [Kordiimonadaceae bacterium]